MTHIGSWGLPDYGITEGISRLFGGGLTAEGGSNLRAGGLPTAQISTNEGYQPIQGPMLGWDTSLRRFPESGNNNTTPQPTSAPTSSGGQVMGASTDSGGGGEPDIQSQLDSIFNPVFQSLGNQENTLRQNYAPVEGQIRAEGDLSQQMIGNQYQEGTGELATQEQGLGTRKEDALTASTRLYNELFRGGQQRFGGSSSAGEAFNTLTAVEQQRRQGNIWQNFEQGMQQVGTLKANLKAKYDTAVKEVSLQVQQAITDSQAQFRDALAQLNSARFQAQSDKATASLNMLQDLRNKIYTINAQALQFTQQLALNHEATQKQVDDMTNKVYQSIQGGSNVLASNANTGYSPTSNYGITAGQQPVASQPTGQIASAKKEEDNIFA